MVIQRVALLVAFQSVYPIAELAAVACVLFGTSWPLQPLLCVRSLLEITLDRCLTMWRMSLVPLYLLDQAWRPPGGGEFPTADSIFLLFATLERDRSGSLVFLLEYRSFGVKIALALGLRPTGGHLES